MASRSSTKTNTKSLTKTLSSLTKKAKGLGIDTSKAESVLKQTKKQGSKPFSGSSYDTTPKYEVPEGQSVMERYGITPEQAKEEDIKYKKEAKNVSSGGQRAGETKEEARARILGSNFGLAGGPTVMSNASKVEYVVPLLNSRTNSLQSSSGDNTNFDSGGTYGDVGGDQSFDEILGFDKKKKKKKQGDIFDQMGEEDPFLQAQFGILDQMQQSQDKATKEYIRSIRQKYNQREDEQRRSNESGLAQVKQALNLAGSSRYAPISSSGIISSKEAQGIQALQKLDSEENQLIAEAKQAQVDKDYQTLEKKLGLIEAVRLEKSTKAQELQSEVDATNKLQQEEDAIASMISQGITNPVEVYQSLRDQGLDVSLGDVASTLTGLKDSIGGAGTLFEMDNKTIGQLLGAGLSTIDIKAMQSDLASGASLDDILGGLDSDTQEMVRSAFGIDEVAAATPVKIGVGAKTETDEKLIRTRLFSKLANILNKGTISDADRQIIDERIAEFRDAGLGEQEILDTLAGLPPEVNTPYNSSFRDIIVTNSETLDRQNQNIGKISTLLAKGNYTAAMKAAEDIAMQNARKQDPDGYVGTASAQTYGNKIKRLKDYLQDAEELVGPIQGSYQNALGRFRGAEATKLRGQITDLVAEMRKDLSGSAVTESEAKFLEPLIASLADEEGSFKQKLISMENRVMDKYNATRSIAGLPQVRLEEVVDPNRRLVLYSNDIYMPTDNKVDI